LNTSAIEHSPRYRSVNSSAKTLFNYAQSNNDATSHYEQQIQFWSSNNIKFLLSLANSAYQKNNK